MDRMVVEIKKMKERCVEDMENKIEPVLIPSQERQWDGVVHRAVKAVFVKISFVTVSITARTAKMKERCVVDMEKIEPAQIS